MDIITIMLAGVGGVALTAGLGLLAKHLTIDHDKLDRKLDDILEILRDGEK